MSQYPQPYYQPPYGQPPPPPPDFSQYMPPAQADLLGPARRAGALMLVLGALITLLGVCNGGSALVTTPEQIAEQQAMMRAPGMPESPLTPEATRIATAVMGVLTLLVGVAFLVTGAYVRRGSGPAITVGFILSGGLTLLLGLFVLMCLVAAFAMPAIAVFACVLVLPLGMSVWQIAWLVSAARSNASVAAARQQYQAQFYGYQQQQQQQQQQPSAYGQTPYGVSGAAPAPPGYGYGYGYAPPPPAYGQPGPHQTAAPPPQPSSPPPQPPSPGVTPTGDADGPPPPPAAG